MTIEEKLQQIEEALVTVKARHGGDFKNDLTEEDYAVVEAALEIAAGLCTMLKDRLK